MQTLGYRFKPWKGAKALADGESILSYVRETAAERGIDAHIRYGQRVVRADWSTPDARWTVHVEGARSRSAATSCSCAAATTATTRATRRAFEGREDFAGQIVHPQFWPEDLDYAGKRVVVIGSGRDRRHARARAGPNPARARDELQRSPSYVLSVPERGPDRQRPARGASATAAATASRAGRTSRSRPRCSSSASASRARCAGSTAPARCASCRPDYAVDTHFNPRYKPWDQRLCLVPDGDFFKALSAGGAEIVTAEIDRFTERGVRLRDGSRARGRRHRHRHRPEPARRSAARELRRRRRERSSSRGRWPTSR